MQGTLNEAAAAMGGEVIGARTDAQSGARWSGAVLDSRRVEGGELFFALPGEATDGHRFVDRALERGAAAAVVSQPVEVDGPLIRVADCYAALHDLTRAMRRVAPRRLAAITGSAGKTTTKELLAAMLAERFRVGRSPGNFNNLYGFPIALLGIDDDTEWMVAEMGMSEPGELEQISRLGLPDVGVFTNVRAAHLESFGSLRAIAGAKAELLAGMPPDGLVVANADDPEVLWIADRHPGRVVTFGLDSAEADVRAVELERLEPVGTRFRLLAELENGRIGTWIDLPLHGRYNVENFLAAAATALALGVDAQAIASAVAELAPAKARGEVRDLPGGAILVDDTYNSNPSAVAQALTAAAELEGERHWAVLGDMLELGPEGAAFHREAGRAAVASGFDPVFGVGELSRELVDAALEAGVTARWFETAAEAEAEIAPPVAGDVVLVKGSRGIGLERLVAAFESAAAAEGESE